ncbi:MAG: hypothetical protein PHF08_03655 [Candidatus Riflebacteria bacterium]|jgi:hypothetical protein|nr:hypothetical protein [Candidatus Riflebacteria bacterium]
MTKIALTEAANLTGINRDKARYWSTLLDLEIAKEGRVSYLPGGAEKLLLAMAQSVSGGLSPSVAAQEVKALHALPVESPAPICNQDNHTADKIADLEKAVLLLAEQNKILGDQHKMLFDQNKQLFDQNKAMLSMIQAQGNKMDFIAARLLPAPASKPVNVWQPTTRQTQSVSFFKRLWLELIAPEQLRATP